MEIKHYIRLSDNSHKEVSLEEFSSKFNDKMRIVKQTQVGSILVSTVFLGFDLNAGFKKYNSDLPVLYETMVFGGVYSDTTERSQTYDEAIESHRQAVELVKTTGWFYSFVKVLEGFKKETIKWLNSEKPKEKK